MAAGAHLPSPIENAMRLIHEQVEEQIYEKGKSEK